MPCTQVSSCEYGEPGFLLFFMSLIMYHFILKVYYAPVILIQLANKQGSEMVDAIMKVIGVKHKMNGERITQSQYVRVNLVDFEHPFFSRVWHGVHILDGTSPLLKESAKKKIRENGGSWPSEWFKPKVIHDKLDFEDLVSCLLRLVIRSCSHNLSETKHFESM